MGGHSHWAGIKHKKALTDAKKGKVYTKIIKEITIAARLGGGKPEDNPRLRKAMDDAKDNNMPLDNVKRAIARGTGQEPGVVYEELTYEGYGPAGTAVIVNCTTDSKNRTASEIRKLFDSHGGKMGGTGCVSYMFKQKGQIIVSKETMGEDELMNIALEAGAEDFKSEEGSSVYEIITAPEDFETVKKALEDHKVEMEQAEITMLADNKVEVGEDKAEQVLNFMEALDDHDDVQTAYSNYNISEEILEKLDR